MYHFDFIFLLPNSKFPSPFWFLSSDTAISLESLPLTRLVIDRALTALLESLGSLQGYLARRMCESIETVAAGWSPISPNRTLGRRCRFWPNWNWGPGFSPDCRAVVVAPAVVVAIEVVAAVVIRADGVDVAVVVGPMVIVASSDYNSVVNLPWE